MEFIKINCGKSEYGEIMERVVPMNFSIWKYKNKYEGDRVTHSVMDSKAVYCSISEEEYDKIASFCNKTHALVELQPNENIESVLLPIEDINLFCRGDEYIVYSRGNIVWDVSEKQYKNIEKRILSKQIVEIGDKS